MVGACVREQLVRAYGAVSSGHVLGESGTGKGGSEDGERLHLEGWWDRS